MKRAALIVGAVIFIFIGAAVSDSFFSIMESRHLSDKVGDDDFLNALSGKISIGMERSRVEREIEGFRYVTEEPKNGESTLVSYGYWFGFIPPFKNFDWKLAGEINVTYSKDGRVLDSGFWYN